MGRADTLGTRHLSAQIRIWLAPLLPPAEARATLAEARALAESGNRTRLLKIEPGAFSTMPFVHEYWEEVFLVAGDLICGSDDKGQGGEQFKGPTYCVRPPGVHHGPFTSKTGCILLETHYYVPK